MQMFRYYYKFIQYTYYLVHCVRCNRGKRINDIILLIQCRNACVAQLLCISDEESISSKYIRMSEKLNFYKTDGVVFKIVQ